MPDILSTTDGVWNETISQLRNLPSELGITREGREIADALEAATTAGSSQLDAAARVDTEMVKVGHQKMFPSPQQIAERRAQLLEAAQATREDRLAAATASYDALQAKAELALTGDAAPMDDYSGPTATAVRDLLNGYAPADVAERARQLAVNDPQARAVIMGDAGKWILRTRLGQETGDKQHAELRQQIVDSLLAADPQAPAARVLRLARKRAGIVIGSHRADVDLDQLRAAMSGR